jgi:S1-C subfamily serine protease
MDVSATSSQERQNGMKAGATYLAAAALVVSGALADHVISGNANAVPVGAAGAVTAQPIDSVTINAYKIASPAVVYVDNVGIGSGSGVIYDSTGDIVTNAHVVSGEKSLKVTLSTGKTYTATLRGTDVADDLAVIHISASGLPAAHFAGQGDFQVAQEVLAIGSPLGLQQTVTSGLISALGRTVQESTGAYLPDAVQTSAPINPGNSGGALVALNGAVVGIPTLEASDPQNNNGGAAQGIGFAVPSYRVTDIAHQIIANGKVLHTGRAYLGVGATDSGSGGAGNGNPFFGFGNPTPAVPGALVENVAQGSPAAAAGIQQGDVITAMNGQTITSESDLLVALAHAKPGQTVSITLNRNGQTVTVHATLGELPAS